MAVASNIPYSESASQLIDVLPLVLGTCPWTRKHLQQGPPETNECVVQYSGCWVGTPQHYSDSLSKTRVLWKKSQMRADASNDPGTLTGFDQWWVGIAVSQETTASGGEEPDAP